MKIKALFTSVGAHVDELITKVENHEALADAAIKEAKLAVASVQTQIDTNQHQLQLCQQQSAAAEEKVVLWQARAIQLKAEDETKALQCLEAMQQVEAQKALLIQEEQQLTAVTHTQRQHLDKAKRSLAQLQIKKQQLAARSAANRIDKQLSGAGSTGDDVFQRWEVAVAADELADTPLVNPQDQLDAELANKEQQQALKELLNRLPEKP